MSIPTPDLSALRGVLFDMDGVVIDSEPVSARIMQDAARTFGFEVPDEAMESFKGLPGNVVFERVATEFGSGQVDGAELRAVRDRLYESVLEDIPLMDALRDLLGVLSSCGWRMAIVTSSRRRHAETVVDSHALRPFFQAILGSEDVANPKPAPDPYVQAAERLGVDPTICLAVEDSPNGIRSASAAGCVVVGFGSEFQSRILRDAGAQLLARDHASLADLIGGVRITR